MQLHIKIKTLILTAITTIKHEKGYTKRNTKRCSSPHKSTDWLLKQRKPKWSLITFSNTINFVITFQSQYDSSHNKKSLNFSKYESIMFYMRKHHRRDIIK